MLYWESAFLMDCSHFKINLNEVFKVLNLLLHPKEFLPQLFLHLMLNKMEIKEMYCGRVNCFVTSAV